MGPTGGPGRLASVTGFERAGLGGLMAPLLQVKDLRIYFYTEEGVVKAVDGISYDVDEGETLAIVGESGCGKSVGALGILRLLPIPPGRIVSGEVMFEGEDLLK